MAGKNWRKSADLSIKDHLEVLIDGVHKHRNSYKKSKNSPVAQLWCALANFIAQTRNYEAYNSNAKNNKNYLPV